MAQCKNSKCSCPICKNTTHNTRSKLLVPVGIITGMAALYYGIRNKENIQKTWETYSPIAVELTKNIHSHLMSTQRKSRFL